MSKGEQQASYPRIRLIYNLSRLLFRAFASMTSCTALLGSENDSFD